MKKPFEQIVIDEYIKGTPIKEIVKTLKVQMTYVRTIIDTIKQKQANEKVNEFNEKHLQIIFIENELFKSIKLEKKTPSYENKKKTTELQMIYAKFLLI